MNQSTLHLILITLGVGLCGLYGSRFSTHQSASEELMLQEKALRHFQNKSQAKVKKSKEELQQMIQSQSSNSATLGSVMENTDGHQKLAQTIKLLQDRVQETQHNHLKIWGPQGVVYQKLKKIQAQLAKQAKVSPQQRLTLWSMDHGLIFALGIILILIGSYLAKTAMYNALQSQANQDHTNTEGEAEDFASLLHSIDQDITQLHQRMLQDLHTDPTMINPLWIQQIERLQKESMYRLISVRYTFRIKYGVDAFTSVFGSFSQAERRLNRAWSALVDQHIAEALVSVQGSVESMQDARQTLDQLLLSS